VTDDLEATFAALRDLMVAEIRLHALAASEALGGRGISDRVMNVMRAVPRHRYVPPELRAFAYYDSPLPIGHDKTISQPFIVALMTELLEVAPTDRVLDVGTGLGYQAAVLAELAATVYTVEIVLELGHEAERIHESLGYRNIVHRIGDGSGGWEAQAPFDKILVAAAPELIPEKLILQLAPGGRMVIPAGRPDAQQLYLLERTPEGQTRSEAVLGVRFSSLVRPS